MFLFNDALNLFKRYTTIVNRILFGVMQPETNMKNIQSESSRNKFEDISNCEIDQWGHYDEPTHWE